MRFIVNHIFAPLKIYEAVERSSLRRAFDIHKGWKMNFTSTCSSHITSFVTLLLSKLQTMLYHYLLMNVSFHYCHL